MEHEVHHILNHIHGLKYIEEILENANGDFTKYWLNGEVLIVRMVDGKLVAETH